MSPASLAAVGRQPDADDRLGTDARIAPTIRASDPAPLAAASRRPAFVRGGQELGEQVAVRRVQLDDLEAGLDAR